MLDKLIVMLTHNDQTASNAQELFDQCKDLPVQKWGFKDVGMKPDLMIKLCQSMKQAGKETFLEVVTYTEQDCMNGAKLAVECGFDYLCGTLYFESVHEYIKTTNLKYLPFVGQVSGSPSILKGSLQSMLEEEARFADVGIFGTDLLGYRYKDGDPEELAEKYIKGAKLPVVLAGSIASDERMDIVRRMDPWGFTMGSALFVDAFKKGDFRSNLEHVIEYCQSKKKEFSV